MDKQAEHERKASLRRHHLVQTLKQEGAINDSVVEAAFLAIPRHRFLHTLYLPEPALTPHEWKLTQQSAFNEDAWLELIYSNAAWVIQLDKIGIPSSSSSMPTIMAQVLEKAELKPGLHVLEIGTGTGYNAALIAHIIRNPALLTSIELDTQLAQQASQVLDSVVGHGAVVVTGDGLQGYQPRAPYDRIIVAASTPTLPLAWLDQLCDGGIVITHLPGHIGPGGMVYFRKHGPGRAGIGHIIRPSSFMELQNSSAPLPTISQLFPQLLSGSITARHMLNSGHFDPMLLLNQDLAFLLQIVFPKMFLLSISKDFQGPSDLCLLDDQTSTLLIFQSIGEQQWQIEVRGEVTLWERLLLVYQQWEQLQRPDATDYHILIDAEGEQILTLPAYGPAVPLWLMAKAPEVNQT